MSATTWTIAYRIGLKRVRRVQFDQAGTPLRLTWAQAREVSLAVMKMHQDWDVWYVPTADWDTKNTVERGNGYALKLLPGFIANLPEGIAIPDAGEAQRRWEESADDGTPSKTDETPAPESDPTACSDGKIWRRVQDANSIDGARVTMYYATFGKGKWRSTSWRIFRDGQYAGYAVNQADADENWQRVMDGLVLDSATGNYVPASYR